MRRLNNFNPNKIKHNIQSSENSHIHNTEIQQITSSNQTHTLIVICGQHDYQ